MDVRGIHLQDAQQIIPIGTQGVEGGIRLCRVQVLRYNRLNRPLVDALRAGRIELLVLRIFVVTQQEDDLAAFARLQGDPHVMRAHRRPAVSYGVERLPTLHSQRIIPPPIRSQEHIALGVEPGDFLRAGEEGEVIPPLAIFGLVVDHAIFDLHLAGAEVALEVGSVVVGVPQAKLDAGEK